MTLFVSVPVRYRSKNKKYGTVLYGTIVQLGQSNKLFSPYVDMYVRRYGTYVR